MHDIYICIALLGLMVLIKEGPMSGQRSRPWKRRTWPQGVLKELASKRRWFERARRMSAGRRRTVSLLVNFSLCQIIRLVRSPIYSFFLIILSLCAHGVSPQHRIHCVYFPEYLGWRDRRPIRNSLIFLMSAYASYPELTLDKELRARGCYAHHIRFF